MAPNGWQRLPSCSHSMLAGAVRLEFIAVLMEFCPCDAAVYQLRLLLLCVQTVSVSVYFCSSSSCCAAWTGATTAIILAIHLSSSHCSAPQFIKLLQCLGGRILAHDPYPSDEAKALGELLILT